MSLISFNCFYEFSYSFNEATQIEIDQINNLKDDKLFVSIGGGIGAGKTYLANKFVDLPIVDVDDYVIEASSGIYDRSNLSIGRNKFKKILEDSLHGEESFVHMGTNTNINGVRRRLKEAKENGFTNILVLVDTKPEIAIQQVKKRSMLGERNLITQERIIQSHEDAVKVFELMKKEIDLVDFCIRVRR
jgi:dephospho-CoA kinase